MIIKLVHSSFISCFSDMEKPSCTYKAFSLKYQFPCYSIKISNVYYLLYFQLVPVHDAAVK